MLISYCHSQNCVSCELDSLERLIIERRTFCSVQLIEFAGKACRAIRELVIPETETKLLRIIYENFEMLETLDLSAWRENDEFLLYSHVISQRLRHIYLSPVWKEVAPFVTLQNKYPSLKIEFRPLYLFEMEPGDIIRMLSAPA